MQARAREHLHTPIAFTSILCHCVFRMKFQSSKCLHRPSCFCMRNNTRERCWSILMTCISFSVVLYLFVAHRRFNNNCSIKIVHPGKKAKFTHLMCIKNTEVRLHLTNVFCTYRVSIVYKLSSLLCSCSCSSLLTFIFIDTVGLCV